MGCAHAFIRYLIVEDGVSHRDRIHPSIDKDEFEQLELQVQPEFLS